MTHWLFFLSLTIFFIHSLEMSTSGLASIKHSRILNTPVLFYLHQFRDDQNSYLNLCLIIKAHALPVFLSHFLPLVLSWATRSSSLYSWSFWTLSYSKCLWVVLLESSRSPPAWVVVWAETMFWLGTSHLQTYVDATVCLLVFGAGRISMLCQALSLCK